jgi:hypothetical protein
MEPINADVSGQFTHPILEAKADGPLKMGPINTEFRVNLPIPSSTAQHLLMEPINADVSGQFTYPILKGKADGTDKCRRFGKIYPPHPQRQSI